MVENCVENPDVLAIQVDECEISHRLDIERAINGAFDDNSVLLVLNQKIQKAKLVLRLWTTRSLRVCADGGANRLYDLFEDGDDEQRQRYVPDYIIGDLDSIRNGVLNYYKGLGTVIIKQATQYSTDFTKSVDLISLHYNCPEFIKTITSHASSPNYGIEPESGIHSLCQRMSSAKLLPIEILAVGGIDGRFDQTIHSITRLYTLAVEAKHIKLYYLTPTDFIFLAPTGGLLLEYSPSFRQQCIGNCGILPLGKETEIIKTIGLKWDLESWPTSVITGQVSSSNRFVGQSCCYISTKDPLIMNIELFPDSLFNCEEYSSTATNVRDV